MKTENGIRIWAGLLVSLSSVAAFFHSQWWLVVTLFVGLNLFQSGFTNWCLAAILMEKLQITKR